MLQRKVEKTERNEIFKLKVNCTIKEMKKSGEK